MEEICRSFNVRMFIGKQLGIGAFGVVLKGEAYNIRRDETVTTVAVKKVRINDTETLCMQALVSELKVLIHIGNHMNIVNLLGACTKTITKGKNCIPNYKLVF